jgi:hypothetical protein
VVCEVAAITGWKVSPLVWNPRPISRQCDLPVVMLRRFVRQREDEVERITALHHEADCEARLPK